MFLELKGRVELVNVSWELKIGQHERNKPRVRVSKEAQQPYPLPLCPGVSAV